MVYLIRQSARVLLPALLVAYLALKCWKLFKANSSQSPEEWLLALLLVGFLFTIGVVVELSSEKGGPIAIGIALAGVALSGLMTTDKHRAALDEWIDHVKASAFYDRTLTKTTAKAALLFKRADDKTTELRKLNDKVIADLIGGLRANDDPARIELLRRQRDRNYVRLRNLKQGAALCLELAPPSEEQPASDAALNAMAKERLEKLRRAELLIDRVPTMEAPSIIRRLEAHSIIQLVEWALANPADIVVEPIIGSILTNCLLAVLALLGGRLNHQLSVTQEHENVIMMPARRKAG
uniref:Uncharacterized protein n=1 Tax=Solibacter usitatus (strain Ellin6076) TaxID=234267 RepID=Q020F3_SOLUE